VLRPEVAVCVPAIPPRVQTLLPRALESVSRQELPPAGGVSVALDYQRCGAAVTRDRALAAVNTPLVAFLDDDDELLPQHLRRPCEHMAETGADYVFPWFTVVGGTDPFPAFFGMPWDDAVPHQTTVTFLARTDLIREVGGFSADYGPGITTGDPAHGPNAHRSGEDFRLTLRCIEAGARIVHLPERTWLWHHDSQPNTSGRSDRW
jgi:Glycosyl transferase family 2